MNKLISSFLALALLAPAACTEAPGTDPEVASESQALLSRSKVIVQSRTSTTNALTVNFTVAGVAHNLTVSGDATATTQVVRRGSLQVLRATVRRDGTGTILDHRGRTTTLAELKRDPGLAARFDDVAMATLEPHVFGFLSGNGTSANPCLAGLLGVAVCAIGAYIAYCVDWGYNSDGTVWIEGGCADE